MLPTVRFASYIIGSDWSSNDTNKPYHDWNAQHYDVNVGYSDVNAPILKQYNPNAVAIHYDNITNNYAGSWRFNNQHWMDFAEVRGISYEHVALHYAVDTVVRTDAVTEDRPFFRNFGLMVSENAAAGRMNTLHNVGYRLPNVVGEFLAVGHALRFDILYFSIVTPAAGGYDGVWEYCNGVDAEGKPASWAPLTIVEDTTVVNGQKFAQSGYVRFIPPKERTEWKRAMIWETGENRWHLPWRKNFWVRFRVTSAGSQRVALTQDRATCIMNEDFVKATGTSGVEVIPGWDTSWETNPANNGDPEYNPNPPSSGGPGVARSARFKWWSRVWYYRPDLLRFLCNVSDPYYQEWISGPWLEALMAKPGIDGWYCDNYTWKTAPEQPIDPPATNLIEIGVFNMDAYAVQMGELYEKCAIKVTQLGRIHSANNLVQMTNTENWHRKDLAETMWTQPDRLWMSLAPGLSNREISMYYGIYYAGSWSNTLFGGLIAEMYYRMSRGCYIVPMYAYREAVKVANNTKEWWDREKTVALALYLLIRDPGGEYIFLNAWHRNFFYGEFLTVAGDSVNIYWQAGIPKQKAYYVDAARFNFGEVVTTVPSGYTPVVAFPNSWYPGAMPGLFFLRQVTNANVYDSNGSIIATNGWVHYFARRYTNALVVYRKGHSGTRADSSTVVQLDGNYKLLLADGTLSENSVNSINLANDHAAILIPTEQPPPSNPDIQINIQADKSNPKPLDVVTVTITATNAGAGEARNVRIRHTIPQQATLVQGSLRLNGQVQPDPADGRNIDLTVSSLPAGGQAVVQFQMVIR